jgi:hypothetical protein
MDVNGFDISPTKEKQVKFSGEMSGNNREIER